MYEERLSRLAKLHLLREIRPIESASGPTINFQDRTAILMASNDYLGLATHPALKRAAIEATERFGVGSGASRLVSGTLPPHVQLEKSLAQFKDAESALVFGSGYLANIGLIPALINAKGLILADRLCHASLIDGCRLSGADFRVYRHRDTSHLERLLMKSSPRRTTLIVTDGVFSMDGDLAPLPELVRLARHYQAKLLVDDAHGTGVMGRHGRGTLEYYGVEPLVPFHMGTFSKAMGASGAYVVGSESMIRYLVNSARSFIYTTAPPPAIAAACVAGMHILKAEPERRARLWENRAYFSNGLKTMGFPLTDTQSPILPVLIGDSQKALAMSNRLLEWGVYAPAIRPPTVPNGSSRIRTTVTSEHTREQLDIVLDAFQRAGHALAII